ncbi:MAG: metallophosphoesterase [Clostridia bacterium]|nr:metallophosphoesterase [Clostridia bacterium]
MKRKKLIKIIITAVILIFIAVMIVLGNTMIEVNNYKITNQNLPSQFNGYKIAHVSDFHNRKNYDTIVEKIKENSPDIICITGDLIDSRNTKTEISLDFVKKLVEIAPCYYVMGNHESRLTEIYPNFENDLKNLGVTVLRNQAVTLNKNGETITLIGLDDPRLSSKAKNVDSVCQTVKDQLSNFEINTYTIVMCHRPEAFTEYVNANVDLALTGHAHGGQVILPFIGGVIAPNQGLFPKYYKGTHTENNTTMIVSRGLGNSLCPIRINNSPEIIIVELGE